MIFLEPMPVFDYWTGLFSLSFLHDSLIYIEKSRTGSYFEQARWFALSTMWFSKFWNFAILFLYFFSFQKKYYVMEMIKLCLKTKVLVCLVDFRFFLFFPLPWLVAFSFCSCLLCSSFSLFLLNYLAWNFFRKTATKKSRICIEISSR